MKRRIEISQHCWKFIYKHLIWVYLLYVTYFIFCNFFLPAQEWGGGGGGGGIFLQINPAAVAFIGILMAAWEGLKVWKSLTPVIIWLSKKFEQCGFTKE